MELRETDKDVPLLAYLNWLKKMRIRRLLTKPLTKESSISDKSTKKILFRYEGLGLSVQLFLCINKTTDYSVVCYKHCTMSGKCITECK